MRFLNSRYFDIASPVLESVGHDFVNFPNFAHVFSDLLAQKSRKVSVTGWWDISRVFLDAPPVGEGSVVVFAHMLW